MALVMYGSWRRSIHDRDGCDCGERCAYRRGRLGRNETRCPDCGFVSTDGTHAQHGHDEMCGELICTGPHGVEPCTVSK